eukprot:TRINITY_DN67139_c0_g1_i1.p1 TRINITY_DN67139_c0_g1~~TRINITY_DN67139_c0_g1_i1.p1  ORF type:complete len:549 (-),score=133.43 TRINITY_DN67139_c0_g1_i1:131-1777(-)
MREAQNVLRWLRRRSEHSLLLTSSLLLLLAVAALVPVAAADAQAEARKGEGHHRTVRKAVSLSASGQLSTNPEGGNGESSGAIRAVITDAAGSVEPLAPIRQAAVHATAPAGVMLQLATKATTAEAAAGDRGRRAPPHRVAQAVLSWAVRQGVKGAENLEVADFKKGPAGRIVQGLTPKQSVKKGDVVLSVPAKLIICSAGERCLAPLKALFGKSGVPLAALTSKSHQLRLSASLLTLHNFAHESWSGYLESLATPSELREYHPTTASPGLLWAFRELPTTPKIREQQQRRAMHLDEFWSLGGRVSPEDWEWAEVTVSSRAWTAPATSGGIMLVPVADFVNSGPASEQNLYTRLGDPEKGEPFELIATKDISAGSELVDYYAAASDDLFVQSWGMVMPNNSVQVTALDAPECSKLSEAVGVSTLSPDGTCRAPEAQMQKEAFCTLARLAAEHCRNFRPFPCPDNLCFQGDALFADLQRLNQERPFLFRGLVLLAMALFAVRLHSLVQFVTPKPRPVYRRADDQRVAVLSARRDETGQATAALKSTFKK